MARARAARRGRRRRDLRRTPARRPAGGHQRGRAADLRALERPEESGVYNIGTGVGTSVVTLFDRLRRAVGGASVAEHGPAKAGEQRRSVLDATLAKRRLDWTPQVDLAEGVALTVECFRRRLG